jgi:hypothetical protein
LPDDAVCIGDRYQIGSAMFEVTQPRVTCYRVGIRMNEPRMPALLTSGGRPGFYFRVLQERWRRTARHGRSCGCTRLAISSIIPSPPKSAASCSRSRTAAALFVTAGRARATR